MRAAAYTRVSSAEQTERYSLPVQRADLADYARRQGWPAPVGYEDAGRSAYTDDFARRPAFARLLADAEAGLLDVVLCIKLDRFARNSKLARQALDRLLAAGCRLVSVYESLTLEPTTTAAGMFQFNLYSALAEMDSHAKSERVLRSLAEKSARGLHHGGVHWGALRVDGRLTIHPDRAADLAHILERAAVASDAAIAAELNRRGLPGPRGGVWHDSSIQHMIAHGAWLLEQAPPWPDRWLAAKGRPRLPRVVARSAPRFLSGLMRCACGGRINYGKVSILSTGLPHHGVQCTRRDRATLGYGTGCPYRKTDARRYEDQTLAFLTTLRHRGDGATAPDASPAVGDLVAARADLAERRRLAGKALRARAMDDAEFDAEIAALDAEEAGLLRSASPVVPSAEWAWLRATLPTLAPAAQNLTARTLLDHVLIVGSEARPVLRPEVARVLTGPGDT